MKVKNMPAKKLKRQLVAQGKDLKDCEEELINARAIRTKKKRGGEKR